MRGRTLEIVVFLVLPLVASLVGCGGSSEEVVATSSGNANLTEMRSSAPSPPPPPSAPSSAESPATSGKARVESAAIGTVLASWNNGEKDDAVEQLLSTRWDDPGVFDDVPHLNLSEDEFRALSRDERTGKQKEYIELVSAFKNLSRHCFSVGENAQASGDRQMAKAHYEAVLHLGEALSSPERVSIMQGTGMTLMRMAAEKLSALN